ncbi:MAG: DinB family protein [Lewinellaceae bacterium]|nr:DinB family protein [Lewinellaceae bacterium]
MSWQHQLDQLDQELASLLADMRRFEGAQLTQHPAPGKWSALENIYHLWQAEQQSLRYVMKKTSSGVAGIPKVGPIEAWRKFLIVVNLRLPVKIKAPAGVNPGNLPAVNSLDEVAAPYLAFRQELRAFLQALPADAAGRAIYKHPFAGRLSASGMILFFAEHFRRHAAQIRRTLG